MPPQTLRPYQERGIELVLEAYKQGARAVLMTLPTGGGKTSCFAWLTSKLVHSGKKALLVVHRRELADQAANRFREFGTDFGFIMAGEQRKPYAALQIASVQTLVRRQAPPADLVICDEAHLSTAKTWNQVLSQYPNARILGCTATPFRLSGKPLVGAYDTNVVVATPAELRELGFLCDYTGFSFKAPDLSGVKKTAGDYNEQQSAAAMMNGTIVDNILEMWLKHARDLSTVAFAVTVEHSKALCAKFQAAGIRAEHVDGSTPLEQRRAILKRVDSGATRVLCNVGIAVEGLDIPRLKCCIDAAPTMSLARAIQKWGRVRRPWNGLTARIHDHCFNVRQHGLPDDPRDYTLQAAPPPPDSLPSLTICTQCLATYRGTSCPACRAVNAPAERQLKTIADAEKVEFSSAAVPDAPKPPVDVKWTNVGRMIEGVFSKQWDEPTAYGKQRRYMLKGDRDYVLPGTTRLNALMARVEKGAQVRVTFTGETPLGDGKARKEFRVEVDRSAPAPKPKRLGPEAMPFYGKLIAAVEDFIADECVIDPHSSTNADALFPCFRSYVKTRGPLQYPDWACAMHAGAPIDRFAFELVDVMQQMIVAVGLPKGTPAGVRLRNDADGQVYSDNEATYLLKRSAA